MKSVLVIGAGIHGIASALRLARAGCEVTVLDEKWDILGGTSGATQQRAHSGYHYPRCMETALECAQGLAYFRQLYPYGLYDPPRSYYAIAREGSHTSPAEYEKFMGECGLKYEEAYPSELDRSLVEKCYRVSEPVYRTARLKEILRKELDGAGVRVRLGAEIIAQETLEDEILLFTGSMEEFTGALVVNATYTWTNNIFSMFGLRDRRVLYRLQTVQILRLKSPLLHPALTVMDGPFCSLLPDPDAGEGAFLLYHARESISREEHGYYYTPRIEKDFPHKALVEASWEFLPYLKYMDYEGSLISSRPVPIDVKGDSRKTRIVRYPECPRLYSILEGKFVSAFLTADRLFGQIKEDGYL